MANRLATVVAVTGLPCTGKSTLAARLQRELVWPLLAKDAIKETLFDTLGWSDRAWSRRVSDASYELLFALLKQTVQARTNVIIEANFRAEHAARFGELPGSLRLVQILCVADGELLQQRFMARARDGTRHPGHVDEQAYAELAPQLARGMDALRLPNASLAIEWDTTQPQPDIAPLLARLRE